MRYMVAILVVGGLGVYDMAANDGRYVKKAAAYTSQLFD
jgi:hypothetical protein